MSFMSVQFVIGRAGSGKTLRCYRAIVEALRADPLGPPIYWLLPRQATFDAERELACTSGLPGFCRARVLSFEQLADDLLGECGGAAVPRVTPLGRQMLLGLLLRRHRDKLRFFSSVAHQPGLASKLDATFSELERCGKGEDELHELWEEIQASAAARDPDVDPLADKIHDLYLIYGACRQYLGQERLDPRRRMDEVLDRVEQSPRLRGADIYVDEFWEFDEFERRLLIGLARICRDMRITLLMDPDGPAMAMTQEPPDELSLLHRVEDTRRKLLAAFTEAEIDVAEPVMLKEAARFESDELRQVERHMIDPTIPAESQPPADIEMVEAPDRRAEVEQAARTIDELMGGGLRRRDIAVLVRRLELYHDLITAVFREHGIPCFIDRRRAMTHHPLLEFLRGAMSIINENWPHDAVMGLIKSGLAGIGMDDADALENYVLEHCLRGPVWEMAEPWTWGKPRDGEVGGLQLQASDSPQAIEPLRRAVAGPIQQFMAGFPDRKAAAPLRQIVRRLFEMIESFGVRATLGRWIAEARAADDHEQAGEHEQAWRQTTTLFDELVDLLGEEPTTLADFQEIIEAGLETLDLALAPPTVDQVLVGQVDRTRTPRVRAVLLLGMNEGVFPSIARDPSILSDSDRGELRRHEFDVEAGTERQLLDENLMAYIAFTRSSHRLILSRSLSDDAGRPLGPSQYWRRMREIFPALAPRVLPRNQQSDPALIATPRQLLTGLMQWGRRQSAPEAASQSGEVAASLSPWPALYQWLATHPSPGEALDHLRRRAWPALAYTNAATLDRELGGRLFPSGLVATAAQIESFAACPFQHFVKFGLDLRHRDEQELPEIPMSLALHRMLEQLVEQMLRRRRDWSSLPPAQARELVQSYAAQVARELRGDLLLRAGRNRYLLGRIERILEDIITSQRVAAQRGKFEPALAGVSFGSEGADLPALVIETPAGRQIQLSGRIDRVDMLQEQAAMAVMDYHARGKSLIWASVYHGLSVQLLSALLVLQAHGRKLLGVDPKPAAALYVQLLRQLDAVNHPSDAAEPTEPSFLLGPRRRGVVDEQYVRDLDGELETGQSDLLGVFIKKDGDFGKREWTDVTSADELAAVLLLVRRQLARLADQIMDGRIEVRPYRIGTTTPCPSCQFRSVCRFEPAVNPYRFVNLQGKGQVIEKAMEEADRAG